MDFIEANIPDFRSYTEKDRQVVIERVKQYLKSKEYSAKTFEEYTLTRHPIHDPCRQKGCFERDLLWIKWVFARCS